MHSQSHQAPKTAVRNEGREAWTASKTDSKTSIILKHQPQASYRDAKMEKVPLEWIERTHPTSPGEDWRAIEAASIQQLASQKAFEKSNGNWIERGPSNIPGRITDVDIDFTNEIIYSLSDHGIVFRSDLDGNNVIPQNDQYPLGLDVASQLKHIDGSNGQLIAGGYMKVLNGWGLFHSSDGGVSWDASAGFPMNQIMGIRRLATENDDAYLFVQEHDGSIPTDYYRVYKSVDQGVSFSMLYQSAIPIGNGGRHTKSDMWVSNDPSDTDFYLMLEDSLFSVNKNSGARNFETIISGNNVDLGLLTGHSENGVVELTAYEALAGVGYFYSWSSLTSTPQLEGQLNDYWLSLPFGGNSFTCSAIAADTLYFGGILTSKSTDRGQTWTTIDMDPSQSYALYHGDVPKVLSTINPNTQQEEFYMGTDGGLYKWDNAANSFDSLGIPGLNTTQIYKMVSKQSDPGTMYIGTQDNGYCHTNLGMSQPNVVDFTFQWGGDVSSMASGDGGQTFWLWWLGDGCNYMSNQTSVISNWSPYPFNGAIPYWEAPICVSNHFPDRCYTAGYLNNSNGSHIIKLQANPGGEAIPTQIPANFEAISGARIAAIAISPIDSNYFYVATENGRFYSSTDGGNSWGIGTVLSNSFYPREILPSKINLGEIWIGGSGYSNAPVYHSVNNGNTFSSFSTGMLPSRVNALTTNADETLLFAATSIGPYECEVAGASWQNNAGSTAPINEYMDVEFISAQNTLRFATYARGVWDYQIDDLNLTEYTPSARVSLFPNPTQGQFALKMEQPGAYQVTVTNNEGKVVGTFEFDGQESQFSLENLSKGIYHVKVNGEGISASSKLVISD